MDLTEFKRLGTKLKRVIEQKHFKWNRFFELIYLLTGVGRGKSD